MTGTKEDTLSSTGHTNGRVRTLLPREVYRVA